jgi:hypothetical protein
MKSWYPNTYSWVQNQSQAENKETDEIIEKYDELISHMIVQEQDENE